VHVDADRVHVGDPAGADIEQAIVQRLVRRRLGQDGLPHLGETGLDVAACQHDMPLRHDLGRHERFFHRNASHGHDDSPGGSSPDRRR